MNTTYSLKMTNEKGWRKGFGNLFKANNSSWWHTRKWLIQTLTWIFILIGMFTLTLLRVPATTTSEAVISVEGIKTTEELLQNSIAFSLLMYFTLFGLALPVAAIIMAQDTFVGERQSGTAAWILSKPVSRSAFILSKLAANILGMSVTGVVVHGMIAYLLLSLKTGGFWPASGFAGAMGLGFLNILFYLTLTTMLGTAFKNRGTILGVSLGVALMGPVLLRSVPILNDITPWTFFLSVGSELPTGLAIALGQPMESVTQVVLTALMCLVFVAVTILRFRNEEF